MYFLYVMHCHWEAKYNLSLHECILKIFSLVQFTIFTAHQKLNVKILFRDSSEIIIIQLFNILTFTWLISIFFWRVLFSEWTILSTRVCGWPSLLGAGSHSQSRRLEVTTGSSYFQTRKYLFCHKLAIRDKGWGDLIFNFT